MNYIITLYLYIFRVPARHYIVFHALHAVYSRHVHLVNHWEFFRNRKYLPKPIKMYVNGLRATEEAISKLVNSMKNKMKPTKKTELTEVEDVPESSPAEKINQPNQV